MTDLERLRTEIPPPAKPFAARGDWAAVEAELGLALPADYKMFISTYGSGKVCGFVSVFSPFVRDPGWSLVPSARLTLFAYQSWLQTKAVKAIPYPLYPQTGGLLPFGTTQNCNCLNWLTNGPSDTWEIVVWDTDCLRFSNTGHKSLTSFLADVVQQTCGLVPTDRPLDWFDPPRRFHAVDYDAPR